MSPQTALIAWDGRDTRASADKQHGLTTVTLMVYGWAGGEEPTDAKPVKDAILTLYEVDTATVREPIAKFQVDIAGRSERGSQTAPFKLRKADWYKGDGGGSLKWQFQASGGGDNDRRKTADFVLYLGGRRFYLMVPTAHDEVSARWNTTYEIGWTVEHADGKDEHLTFEHALRVPVRDWVHRMRQLPGRFDDPLRKPAVAPSEAGSLDDLLLARLEHVKGLGVRGPDDVVDLDGLSFSRFLADPSARRAWIVERLKDVETFKEAATPIDSDPLNGPDFYDSDIAKAYWVIHDIGASGTPPSTAGDPKRARKTGGSVHGWMNWGGYYGAGRDFRRWGGGTVYQWSTSHGVTINPFIIGIENVPVVAFIKRKSRSGEDLLDYIREHGYDRAAVEAAGFEMRVTLRRSQQKLFDELELACVGYKKPRKRQLEEHGLKGTGRWWIVFHWTKAWMQAYAQLYVLASARAGHLLTVTAHMEMDRNCARDVIYPEVKANTSPLSKARLDAAATHTVMGKIARRPSDMHGDPYGIDMQTFYDEVSAQLMDMPGLGALGLVKGAVRYGIHPRRVTREPIHHDPPFAHPVTNGSSDDHVFPHQSNPKVERSTTMLQSYE